MSLDKLLEALKESSHSCDDIGSVSKKIENQKFKLATSIKDRQMYLEVVNLAIVMQSNIYSMAGLIWDEDEPLDEIVEELKKACNRICLLYTSDAADE